ncbi:acylphosphatase [Reichenbachiella agariperforans]|uniref:acylphosphatase n=1 Tax=Reichenbachiella agariperforans TaxID=156994 RepID=UPI001C09183D|nr:acylphosphatase [Reichenbachiella agariperforans]MBU2913546.1 acylphosphatase [Reichenbachiella agariperforans]
MQIGKSILVSGKVQGVFFRASTLEVAISLGIRGWVKNLADGRVEIEAHGEDSSIEQLFAWCDTGSDLAEVNEVLTKQIAYDPSYNGFEIIY